ncbi:RnfH family protein [Jeongeupia sp. USM3]|uniref:RnfH family protein n=1 Tax=Jeongeupia sp. USM3 TaxID=1906741 RepID=UPI00089DDA0D|nr:RnfH family protein [Jeongeupia sp. USM3]AOX99378.1 RnfH family protein [Jeongeupia sp. USM3]
MSESISVEVVYATPAKQKLVALRVAAGTTAEQAIAQSGLLDELTEIDLAQNKVGIFGKAIKLDAVLREHDRVEIYRPLIADPKEVRRKRVAEGKAMKKGGGEQ